MSDTNQSSRFSSYSRFGVLLAVIGVALAIDTILNLSVLYKLWPLLLTMLGAGFVGIYVRRARHESIYIGIGVYLIGFSILALYCSFTSWAALASLWPVFIGLLGLSFCFGHFFGRPRPSILLAGLLLISLAAVFFFIFTLSHRLWWTVFVLAGISFLIFDRVRQSS
jgi:hypothetical protein